MIFSPKVPSTLPCACVEYFKPACLNAHLILCGMLEQRRASAQGQERIRGRPEKFSRDFTLSLSKGFTLKAAGCQIFVVVAVVGLGFWLFVYFIVFQTAFLCVTVLQDFLAIPHMAPLCVLCLRQDLSVQPRLALNLW